ncbi:hypothetical protein SERLADRAFT_438623, partial [Serpula lacrymans var. lacrymans S7.9]
MTDSMQDLAEALPEVGPAQIQPPMPEGITREIQEWMRNMMEAEVACRVTEVTKIEIEGRLRAYRAAERVEEEAAEYKGLWEQQIATHLETQRNGSGGEKKEQGRLRSALERPPAFDGDQMKFRSFMEHLLLHFEEDPTYFG